MALLKRQSSDTWFDVLVAAIVVAIFSLSVAVARGGAQTPTTQTPTQIIDQIGQLLKQLQTALEPAPVGVTVTTAAELTDALKTGGPIRMAAGTFVGNFVIARPTVLTGAGQSATIIAPKDPFTPPVQINADDVTVRDLTVRNGAPDRETLVVGTNTATSAAALPHRVRLQRLTVVAVNGGHRGVSMHGTDITLDSSSVTGFYEKGRDAQAVWINNGPGPFTITNNVLEASAENVLVGGTDPGIVGVNPSDIVVRGNIIRKPATYRTLGTVKNLLQLKTGVRVLIENNTFDGNWRDGQPGHAIVFTVRNQDGKCTWCKVDEVIFRGNVLTGTLDGAGVNILGSDDTNPSQQTTRITIDRNLFVDSPAGIQVLNGVSSALVVTNNTFPKITQKFLSFSNSTSRPKLMTPLTFSRNVLRMGSFGVTGDGSTGVGLPSLTANATVVEWSGNVIEATAERNISLPAGPGNALVAPGGLAALLDAAYRLKSGTAGY